MAATFPEGQTRRVTTNVGLGCVAHLVRGWKLDLLFLHHEGSQWGDLGKMRAESERASP